MKPLDLAPIVMQRIDALARISEEPDRLTRTFCSPAMQQANDLVASWMTAAGMKVQVDTIGNLIGNYPAQATGKKMFVLGSHLDTVRDAGKFDGPLGVLVAIACIERLRQSNTRLPFDLQVVGFSDEEGVRFHSAYLGSKVLAGTFSSEELKRTDAQGITMAEAIRNFGGNPDALTSACLDPDRLLGYAEVHIEQGPVLEEKNMSAGVVTGIAGQSRVSVTFTGRAGHAGTTPMNLRRDALCAAADFVLAAEAVGHGRSNLVVTVGSLMVSPGASNVIPGEVRLSLDVRHAEDGVCQAVLDELRGSAETIASERNIRLNWHLVQESAAVLCDPRLSSLLTQALKSHQSESIQLHSGAGHDAAAMAAITPVAMLFVRCKSGISHHPDESAAVEDVRIAINVMDEFIRALANSYGSVA
jgi:allantoate deiminase